MTAKEALEKGYSIDRNCYPNLVYKGPRFNPVEVGFVLTDLEQELLEALKVAKEAIGWQDMPSRDLRDAYEVVKLSILVGENKYRVTYKEVK